MNTITTEATSAEQRTVTIQACTHVLAEGEHYAGLVLDDNGQPSHHLFLLPGEREDIKWQDAMDWAKALGGDLPNRREQALLYAHCKGKFVAAWYWSNETHAHDGSYAWFQGFSDGGQDYGRKSFEGRARAVRRFAA